MAFEFDLRGSARFLEAESREIKKWPEQGQRSSVVGGEAQKIPKIRLWMAWQSSYGVWALSWRQQQKSKILSWGSDLNRFGLAKVIAEFSLRTGNRGDTCTRGAHGQRRGQNDHLGEHLRGDMEERQVKEAHKKWSSEGRESQGKHKEAKRE